MSCIITPKFVKVKQMKSKIIYTYCKILQIGGVTQKSNQALSELFVVSSVVTQLKDFSYNPYLLRFGNSSTRMRNPLSTRRKLYIFWLI